MMKTYICQQQDIPELIDFICKHWKSDHVFVTHPELLYWQHRNKEGGLNFLIAKDDCTDEIVGIYGFIPQSHYDEDIVEKSGYNEAWGAIWKVKDDCTIPGLGVLLLKQVAKKFDFLGGIGLSEKSKRIYRAMKCRLGNMNQYYVLNDSLEHYDIAIVNKPVSEIPCNSGVRNFEMKELSDITSLNVRHVYRPCKTIRYLINRYQDHPYYHYKFLGCFINEVLECILVVRSIHVGNRSCERIIDVLGNLENLKDLGGALKEYISRRNNVEYIDFWNWGIEKFYFLNNGFQCLEAGQDTVVIPNYFEPFLQNNVELNFFYLSREGNDFAIFKGDGDQDRPNIL